MSSANDPNLDRILAEAAERRGMGQPQPKSTKGPGRPKGVKNKPKPLLAADQAADLRRLLVERLQRKMDALRLYVPMPLQAEFHTSNAKERLIRGSNRSGKTTAAAVEVARAVTGEDSRYPAKNGIAYLVGKDGREVANVMYRLLFRAGTIKMVRDENTGEWRSFNPTNPLDAMRTKEAKPAPPLIPRRYIRSIAWENKKANLPSIVTLTNGWELHFFSSNGKPPHGSQIDLTWFDEEIQDTGWYSECAARMVDRNGRFIWSATPQAGTAQLFELHVRAEDQARLPKQDRSIEEFLSLLEDNEHVTAQQKQDFASKLSDDELLVRVHGEFASHGLRVFPEFSKKTHICPYFDIPQHWTIYAAIDPGRQVCGVLFMAVPPADEGDYGCVFDELYIRQCSAEIFGQRMREKCTGRTIQAFIIDHQEGRKTETGSGRTVEEQYSEALDRHRVGCVRSGSEFTWGVADPQGGVEAVREWIRPLGSKPPRLRVRADSCPNFIYEMERYWYEKDRDGRVTDKPRDRGPVHLCACIRYIIQDDPVHVPAEQKKPRPGAIWLEAQKIMNPKGKGKVLNLGPGSFTIGVGV